MEIVQQDAIFRELWIILRLVKWIGMKWWLENEKIKVDFEVRRNGEKLEKMERWFWQRLENLCIQSLIDGSSFEFQRVLPQTWHSWFHFLCDISREVTILIFSSRHDMFVNIETRRAFSRLTMNDGWSRESSCPFNFHKNINSNNNAIVWYILKLFRVYYSNSIWQSRRFEVHT